MHGGHATVDNAIHKFVCNGSVAIVAWDELSKNKESSYKACQLKLFNVAV